MEDNEILPHFFTPDFMRPTPSLEGEENLEEEDFDDAYWLLPQVTSELFWDTNIDKELDHSQFKQQFQKALKTALTNKETD